jgi:hypothetical protein
MKAKAKAKSKKRRGNPRIAELGRATRWAPGKSANPGGRPSTTVYSDAHREVSQLAVRELRVKQSDSVAVAVAKRVAREAIRGKISAASEAASRCEGTCRQMIELQQQGDLQVRVTSDINETLEKIRQCYGLPETDAEAAETTPGQT